MLYIVLMPVKRDNVRNLVAINAEAYQDVRVMLRLPEGWRSWVSFTEIELNGMMSMQNQYITKFITKDG